MSRNDPMRYKPNWDLCKNIKLKPAEDGDLVPFGIDKNGIYDELMPDGLSKEESIYERNYHGDLYWGGNYYSKKTNVIGKIQKCPLNTYDKDVERSIFLSNWLKEMERCKSYSKSCSNSCSSSNCFSKDNNSFV